MDEKGVIKFECIHHLEKLDECRELDDLIHYRDLAYQKDFIGVYPNGIGFGNISLRFGEGFLVSGTATGSVSKTNNTHYSLVTDWNINKNQLWCKGPIKASSESLTHAVIYETISEVNAILHIHSEKLWKKYYKNMPSTAADIEYGTPEMAKAVIDLIRAENNKAEGVFLMQGHQDGIVAYGMTFSVLFSILDI